MCTINIGDKIQGSESFNRRTVLCAETVFYNSLNTNAVKSHKEEILRVRSRMYMYNNSITLEVWCSNFGRYISRDRLIGTPACDFSLILKFARKYFTARLQKQLLQAHFNKVKHGIIQFVFHSSVRVSVCVCDCIVSLSKRNEKLPTCVEI